MTLHDSNHLVAMFRLRKQLVIRRTTASKLSHAFVNWLNIESKYVACSENDTCEENTNSTTFGERNDLLPK